ncbi:hypothetical protein ACFPRL_21065 [Pseudoclavibacter helvolus]
MRYLKRSAWPSPRVSCCPDGFCRGTHRRRRRVSCSAGQGDRPWRSRAQPS